MNEVKRYRTTRKLIILNETQIKPFQAICRNVTKELGSERAAQKSLGVSSGVFRRLMLEGFLTNKMAYMIFERRKAMKSANQAKAV